ncbi:hypothetical protein [Arenibaculum pallidiluteum]|uniref:hypothetical protein n=1 Tax=Arenibaculum pallidiluteum TaxID=2812559 RepID=UPI001A967840|nr:hypothetical protein [Arenibaculum pallidiluteum]
MRRIAICLASAAALMAGSAMAQTTNSGVTSSPSSQSGMQQLRDPTVSPSVNGPNNFDCSMQKNAPECAAGDPGATAFGSSDAPGQGSAGGSSQGNQGTGGGSSGGATGGAAQ